jgi:hypothetical protein
VPRRDDRRLFRIVGVLLRSRYVGATTDLSWFDAVRDRLFRSSAE